MSCALSQLSSSDKKPRMLAAHLSSSVIYPGVSAPVPTDCINCWCAQKIWPASNNVGSLYPHYSTPHAPALLSYPLNYSGTPTLLRSWSVLPPNLLCYYTPLMDVQLRLNLFRLTQQLLFLSPLVPLCCEV